ncbi:calcineurin-like phosphoesterase family protein [Bacteroides sp.]|uniref:calcineurin-like phosphoesterase family protein n=1 Tax=Bacteroides sp. TaxID=29523 RepID=UPI002628B4B4|nr:calcineurin-like phosphoesterase family protein [Bacteroides sp.]MDD3038477.1 calcineurin-like phosphoesterase family protein [Bacteroides sp.]
MKSTKFLSTLLLLLSLAIVSCQAAGLPSKKGMTVKGIVTDNKKSPIAGVVVTDGVNFTQTDEKGHYYLPSNFDQSKFVYLSIPADYKAIVENALPTGYYAALDKQQKINRCDFQLEKRTMPANDFTFIAISDPQMKTEKHLARFSNETVPDLEATLKTLNGKEIYGMMLGDISWDAMEIYAPYKEAISKLNLTMYHTIGNHDFDLQYTALSNSQNPNEWAEHVFGDNFGPTDYSFNVGKVHIISMKDIDYQGQKKYKESFTVEQLEWLKKDLSYVKPGTLVLLSLHAPVANYSNKGKGNTRNAAQLFEILQNYKVHIFSGHTHFYENRIVTPDIYEHNIGAACGGWWSGDVNRCGAPNGYLLVDINGEDISWQYKATGQPLDYQFHVYKPGEFQSQPEYLVVNLWDYDPAWSLTYYENGIEKKGVLEAFDDEDQAAITQKKGKTTGYHTLHLFRVRPSANTSKVEIVATNRFGKSFRKTLSIK